MEPIKGMKMSIWPLELFQRIKLQTQQKQVLLKFNKTNGWISAEETRKPAHGEIVLIYVVDLYDYSGQYSLGHFCCKNGWILQEHTLMVRPYFWKRLPDMPEIIKELE